MNLHRINNFLVACIIVINIYVLVAPVLPSLLYAVQNHGGDKQAALSAQIHQKPANASSPMPSQPNHLVIPSMLLDNGQIFEGTDSFDLLNKGVWHVYGTSTPDKGGNTVLAGHRFSYTGPRGIFYFLNKLHPGDEVALWWNNKQYLYSVVSSKEVPPTDVSIEDPTSNPQLTLFTCTPLWHPVNRLVVTATLEKSAS